MYQISVVYNDVYSSMHAYPINVSHLFSYIKVCYFSRIVEKMFVETEGYRLNRQTRILRNSDGKVTKDASDEYIKRIIESR